MNPTSAPRAATLFAPVAADLARVEQLLRQTLESAKPGLARLFQHLHHYRGKRLRPALLLLVARACGNVVPGHHLLAAVVEMIHTATLVHDDVLDSASTRRHVSTVNALCGNQTSILLGDHLFTRAFHLSSTLGDARVCRLIGEATNRLCEGELHQVTERGNLDLGEDDYFDIIDAKTAELTACCCRLGALQAGATEEVVERMTAYGRALGLAFQIADDLLDLVGEERKAGKSLGTDLEQQKLTLPIIHLLGSAAAEQSLRVRALLQTPGPRQRDALLAELESAGSLVYARHRAEMLAEQAVAALEILPPSAYRDAMERLAERVVHRDR